MHIAHGEQVRTEGIGEEVTRVAQVTSVRMENRCGYARVKGCGSWLKGDMHVAGADVVVVTRGVGAGTQELAHGAGGWRLCTMEVRGIHAEGCRSRGGGTRGRDEV
jgi:hypothetical protein